MSLRQFRKILDVIIFPFKQLMGMIIIMVESKLNISERSHRELINIAIKS